MYKAYSGIISIDIAAFREKRRLKNVFNFDHIISFYTN